LCGSKLLNNVRQNFVHSSIALSLDSLQTTALTLTVRTQHKHGHH